MDPLTCIARCQTYLAAKSDSTVSSALEGLLHDLMEVAETRREVGSVHLGPHLGQRAAYFDAKVDITHGLLSIIDQENSNEKDSQETWYFNRRWNLCGLVTLQSESRKSSMIFWVLSLC